MRNGTSARWTRHLFYRTEQVRTTWKFRIGVVAFVLATVWLTSGWWTVALARSLTCEPNGAPSDAILIENFDVDNYLVFENAGELRRAGLAPRILVPVRADGGTLEPNAVALGTAWIVADAARTGPIEIVPIIEREPISLNAAFDVLRFLQRERIESVIVVSPYFRSRRSAFVYSSTLGREGIDVTCQPVQGSATAHNWTGTWHGIQDVVEQWGKLQYYRLYVMPFHLPGRALAAAAVHRVRLVPEVMRRSVPIGLEAGLFDDLKRRAHLLNWWDLTSTMSNLLS